MFPNSDFKKGTFYQQSQYKQQLDKARFAGYKTYVNEVRKINNIRLANRYSGKIKIQDILMACWKDFKIKYTKKLTREGVVKAVEDSIDCGTFTKGFAYYECPKCGEFYVQSFTCKSRFCSSCGKKYRDERSVEVSKKLLDIPHRQFVFTLPPDMRDLFRKHRYLLNVLFQSSYECIYRYLYNNSNSKYIREGRQIGMISFIHTFGRDLKWHHHIHALVPERYVRKDGSIGKYSYFHYDCIRIMFRNIVCKNTYDYISQHFSSEKNEVYRLIKRMKKKYDKGFYIYGPQMNNCSLTGMKELTNYVARYASHPPLSENRITKFNREAKTVEWFYDPHEDDLQEDEEKLIGRQFINESVDSFLSKLLIHIPDKGFQQIRYYGFYSNKTKSEPKKRKLFCKKEINKMSSLLKWENALLNAYGYTPLICSCGTRMELKPNLCYIPKKGDTT